MPHLIGMLGDGNANVLFGGLGIVEQAKLNRGGRFGKEGKVYAVAQPRRAQRIGITEPSLYRSHKRAAHLCGMQRALAITNGGGKFDPAGIPWFARPANFRATLRVCLFAFLAKSSKPPNVIRKITLPSAIICALALAVYFYAHHNRHPLPRERRSIGSSSKKRPGNCRSFATAGSSRLIALHWAAALSGRRKRRAT